LVCVDVASTVPQEQESVYNLLLNLQAEILQKMKDGAVARDLYQHALSYVKKHKPDLEKHFVKNIGFGVSYTN
jgi:nucleosome binding factor SPN SPT16 subunit